MKTKKVLLWTTAMVLSACVGAVLLDYYRGYSGACNGLQLATTSSSVDIADVQNDWKKTSAQVVEAVKKLKASGRPMVSIFGGHKVKKTDPMYAQATFLAKELVKSGYLTISGGGPGIMEAVDCGASSVTKEAAFGISVKNFIPNECIKDTVIMMDNFHSRKWLMMEYSKAFVIFPGGIGTIDEFAQALTLISTGNMEPKPVIFVGKKYWQGITDFLSATHNRGLTSKKVIDQITVTDDMDEVLSIIKKAA